MDFVLAQFVDGKVKAAGWWAPVPGQRVYLYLDRRGDLVIDREPRGVPYTWPRGRNYEQASLLAWRHYRRRTATRADETNPH